MKHLGITHKRGDDSYGHESRCMLGQLEARMRTTGQKFGRWVRTLEDGTVIVATIIMNGVSPIYRVMVTAMEDAVSAYETIWFFESGLLLGSTLYLSAAEDAYFAGSGTVFLPENTTEDLQGLLSLPRATQDWSQLKSYHAVTAAQYASIGWVTSLGYSIDNPSMFSGLMMLAYQAKLGRGSLFVGLAAPNGLRGIFPWDQDIVGNYQSYGMIRTTDFHYFSVKVTDTYTKVCRLQTTEVVEDLRVRLASSRFNEDDAIKAEAVLMSTLTPVYLDETTRDEEELLDSDAMAPSTHGFILGYWWHFSFGDLNECSKITHQTIGYDVGECSSGLSTSSVQYDARKSTISFSFTWNNLTGQYDPSASLDSGNIGVPWWMWSDSTMIWRPSYDHTKIQSFYNRGCENSYGSAPLYCWYDETGYRDVWLTVARMAGEADYHNPPLAHRHACAYIKEAVATESIMGREGKPFVAFTLDAGVAEADMVSKDTHYIEYVCDGFSTTGTVDVEDLFSASNSVSTCPSVWLRCTDGSGGGRSVSVHQQDIDPDWDIYKIEHDFNTELAQNLIPAYAEALVIPRNNASAVAIITRKPKTQTTRTDYTSSNDYLYWNSARSRVSDGTLPHCPDQYWEAGFEIYGQTYLGSGVAWVTSSPLVPPVDGHSYHGNRYLLNLSTVTQDPETDRVYTATLYFNNKEFDLQGNDSSEDNWDGYFNYLWNYGFDAIHFSAPGSYTGYLKHPTKGSSPATPTITGDYTDEEEILESYTYQDSLAYWAGWS